MRKNLKEHRSIPESRPVELVEEGQTYRGTWRVDGDSVEVRSDWGFKAGSVGSSDPSWVARRLLSELVKEGKAGAATQPGSTYPS